MVFNKTITRQNFDQETIEIVWNKANIVIGQDPSVYRKDSYGTWIKRSEYGNIDSQYGWEIDHIKPIAKRGSDYISNLQPLQWKNNRQKGDKYPY